MCKHFLNSPGGRSLNCGAMFCRHIIMAKPTSQSKPPSHSGKMKK